MNNSPVDDFLCQVRHILVKTYGAELLEIGLQLKVQPGMTSGPGTFLLSIEDRTGHIATASCARGADSALLEVVCSSLLEELLAARAMGAAKLAILLGTNLIDIAPRAHQLCARGPIAVKA